MYQAYRTFQGLNNRGVVVDPASCFVDQTRFSIFLGLMGVYFGAFAILAALAEVRTACLRRTVLRPFGFMVVWFGRGCFYIIMGSILVELPIDSNLPQPEYRYLPALVPAIILMICGGLQILISVFVAKVRD